MPVRYYRGPSEPGGDDDIMAEVVDGKFRRLIEISDGAARCIANHGYPFAADIAEAAADYVWPISEQEFNEAWLRHCSRAG